MTAAPPTTPAPAALARVVRIVLALVVVAALARGDRRRARDLVAGGALEQLEQQDRVVDQLAAARQLGLRALLLRRLQALLRDQDVAEALRVPPRDVELDDHRVRQLLDRAM